MCAAQVDDSIDVLSLFGFCPHKVGISKKADYQSRLTTVNLPLPFIYSNTVEDKLCNTHHRDPANFPPNFCLHLLVFCYLMCVFEAAMQPWREGCACCSQFLPLLQCSLEERASQYGKVALPGYQYYNLFISQCRCWMAFLSTMSRFSFVIISKELPFNNKG